MPELRLENSVVDDRYLVDRCLGRGSYAEIFLASEHSDAGCPVIIKALNTSLQGTADPDLERTLIENFQNEAIALDRVRHPHIILRLGHGTAADLEGVPFHYLVLEYMPGGDLWSLCRNSPVSLPDALYYFQQVAGALAYAHSQKVIHRDIKPNNLLLSADRRVVKIADFGVAKMTLDDASEITRVGTNVYAPPEHHPDARAGDPGERLTPSADVYSLAKTIYTAMTGRAPRQFSREPIGELPPELASHDWSAALLAVLGRATASRVADRYQTVEAFWGELAQVKFARSDDQEADDEATIVRSRLQASSGIEPLATRPNFQRLSNSAGELGRAHKARIVVELPDRRQSGAPAGALDQPGDTQNQNNVVEGQAVFATQILGSTGKSDHAATRSHVRTAESGGKIVVASSPEPDVSRSKNARAQSVRVGPSLSARLRALLTSEWLRRVFIIFLAAALIGLAASTYYHFADQQPWLPFLGSAAREGLISGATNVNLRSEPFGSVLVSMPAGTKVRVVEERSGWLRVRVLDWVGSAPDNAPDGGWVDGRFVKID